MKMQGRLWWLVGSLVAALAVGTGCATTGSVKAPTKEIFQISVEQGDTLSSISKQFDVDWHDVVSMNKDTLRDGLRVGQVLNIIPGPAAISALKQSNPEIASEDVDNDDDLKFVPRRKGLLFGGRSQETKPQVEEFIFPVEGSISSYFGKRGRRQHKGIDIAANVGTPIVAAGNGEVVFSGKQHGYGSTVVVDHGGFLTLYAHCSKLIARLGDNVRQGDFIAKVGRTGNARGAHLHFEIRDAENEPINPLPFLKHKSIAAAAPRKSKKDGDASVAASDKKKRGLLYARD